MTEFTAQQSAALADDVYRLADLATVEQGVAYFEAMYGGVFSLSGEDVLKGRTGGPGIIKVRTAFGFTLLGQKQLKGHAVILFRGTQYLADWLTNLNVTVSSSASGHPVHDGFNHTFKSMEPQLRAFMKTVKKNRVHTIHCIGHSLGGALATVCADWLYSRYRRKPYVYTFGSPRVGLHTFAGACTQNVGKEQIFRVYHKTDIVPCIPTWPYVHTPKPGQNYFLPSPGIIPMAEYHGMDHYIESVKGKTWPALANLREVGRDENTIARWLKEESPLGLTITSIEWLNQALVYVLEKCLDGAAWLISRTFSTSFTLMDQLAFILDRGVKLAETTSSWVRRLIRKIMQVIGMGRIVETADLTQQFIRAVLINLQQKINHFTRSVLSQILVKGRAY